MDSNNDDKIELTAKALVPEIIRRTKKGYTSASKSRSDAEAIHKVYISKLKCKEQLCLEITSLEGECDALEEKKKSFEASQTVLLQNNVAQLLLAKSKAEARLAELCEEEDRLSKEYGTEMNNIADLFMENFRRYTAKEDEQLDSQVEGQLQEINKEIDTVEYGLNVLRLRGINGQDIQPGSELGAVQENSEALRVTMEHLDAIIGSANLEVNEKLIEEYKIKLQNLEVQLAEKMSNQKM